MAQAIIGGLVKKEEFFIWAANNGNQERLEYVRDTYQIDITRDWVYQIDNIDIVVLAMPPESHDQILKELYRYVNGQLIVTVAAGIAPSYLEDRLPVGTPTAWIMPNTAGKIGQSMTLYAPGRYAKEQHLHVIESLLAGIGLFEKVTEEQIHQLTAITGSAPAFIYKVAESLTEMAAETGISTAQARKLVSQMIFGSAAMLRTGEDPAQLTGEVATPGGSTAVGLEVLKDYHLDEMLKEAIEACRQKSRD